MFDECWFHQAWRPPAAQLLYDLGTAVSHAQPDVPLPPVTPTPLPASDKELLSPSPEDLPLHLLLSIHFSLHTKSQSMTTTALLLHRLIRSLMLAQPEHSRPQCLHQTPMHRLLITTASPAGIWNKSIFHNTILVMRSRIALLIWGQQQPSTLLLAWSYMNSTVVSTLQTLPLEHHVLRYLVGNRDSGMSAS